jgi:hypothetical protein
MMRANRRLSQEENMVRGTLAALFAAALLVAFSGRLYAQPAWPPDEAAFIKVVQDARDSYVANHSGGAREARIQALCRVLQPTQGIVSNWVGQITKLGPANNGALLLEVTLAEHVRVGTWPNPLSDLQDHTLIPPTSPVYAMLQAVKLGDVVHFSGQFQPEPSNKECARDMQGPYEEKVMEPSFNIQFTSVARP